MISVVIATYNRAQFLQRSLMAYEKSTFKDFELIIIDDWSSDNTEVLCRGWSDRLNIIYLRPPYKEPGTWRSEASIINIGLRASQGEMIIAAHPEIIPGRRSLELMWEHRERQTWHVCKPYFLTYNQQQHLNDVQWLVSNVNLRELPGFYTEEVSVLYGGGLFDHAAIDRAEFWDSWQFGGGLRSMWQTLGGMYPFKTWGSVDMWLASARSHHNIRNYTETDPETIVVHQNHDYGTIATPRDHDLFETLKGIPLTAQELW